MRAAPSLRTDYGPCVLEVWLIRMNGIRRLWLGQATIFLFGAAAVSLFCSPALHAQKKTAWSDREKPVLEQLRKLRDLPDSERPNATAQLAIQIRGLRSTERKELLAEQLANLATEGDPGQATLQEVATTLAQALHEHPLAENGGEPARPYITLAQLVLYEHVKASLDAPQFSAAMTKLEADDRQRQGVDFTLADLNGRSWTLNSQRGNVVLVNFWATWCPPCRKEMPDLEAIYQRFEQRGFVILAITDEEVNKVRPFVADQKISFPVLLDSGRKVNELLHVDGIPKSFVYDRSGKLVAQAIDMRTQNQFLKMLAQAGLK
jgi:peroxiredoxin